MPHRVALLFPGQGAQTAEMMQPWSSHPAGARMLDLLSEGLGADVRDLARSDDALTRIDTSQPALFACQLAALTVMWAEGITIAAVAGHSLGEFAALVAAGVLDPRPALDLVVERARAIQDAVERSPGATTSLIGLSEDEVEELCRVAGDGDMLGIASLTAPRRLTVSGSPAAVLRIELRARARGARAIRLPIPGAAHSPLMLPALSRLRDAVARVTWSTPRIVFVANAAGRRVDDPDRIRELICRQLTSPVRWGASVRALAREDIDRFVEAGPGGVLSASVRRTLAGADATTLSSPDEVVQFTGTAATVAAAGAR